jgi:hypothetical protein
MFNCLISVVLKKKMRRVKRRNVDDFTKGNVRQIICRRYSRGKIHTVE